MNVIDKELLFINVRLLLESLNLRTNLTDDMLSIFLDITLEDLGEINVSLIIISLLFNSIVKSRVGHAALQCNDKSDEEKMPYEVLIREANISRELIKGFLNKNKKKYGNR